MKIVLTGMKHCGKTTLGKQLAAYWSCPFVDTDELLEEYYFRCYGEKLNCREIFRKHGEEFFRELEVAVIEELLLSRPVKSRIVALGGGMPMHPRIRGKLKKLGKIIYLKVEPEEIFRRIEKNGLPPYLDADKPFESFMTVFGEREAIYEEIADLKLNPLKLELAEIAAKIEEDKS